MILVLMLLVLMLMLMLISVYCPCACISICIATSTPDCILHGTGTGIIPIPDCVSTALHPRLPLSLLCNS
jgi:hypothetical protein